MNKDAGWLGRIKDTLVNTIKYCACPSKVQSRTTGSEH